MIMSTILSMITLLSTSMLLAPNPMTAALSLLAMSIMVATTYAMTTSTWLAIMVFLVYVAGMLVMFAYFVAITPNQQIMVAANPALLTMIMISSLIYTSISMSNFTTLDKSIKMLFMYSNNNPATLLVLALILLLTMVVVVKISSQSKGPLRSFMSYV